ncbi:MAG: outer membrane protein [Novosphingobium sp.]
MTSIVRWTLLAGSLSAFAGAASAQTTDKEKGVYIAAAFSVTTTDTVSRTIPNVPAPGVDLTIVNPFNTGYGGAVAAGYDFGRARIEGEFGYTDNGVDRYIVPAGPFAGTLPLDGGRTVRRYMANAYFDLTEGPVRPYIGVGAGAAAIHMRTVGPRAFAPTEPPRTLTDVKDTRFAYQLIGGLSVSTGKRVTVSAQYRWLDAGSIRGSDTAGVPFVSKHRGHNVDIGLRVRI